MPCFYPLNIPHPKMGTPITVPCGRCIGCRLERSRQWAVRILHETKMHDDNVFLTLTYSDENLPENNSLVKRDPQLFIKRLRKKIFPQKISYFSAGEYGDITYRPHYHIIIFGYGFPDKKYLKKSPSGEDLYTSKVLDELWPLGWANIGQVTFESASYCAKYLLPGRDGPPSPDGEAGGERGVVPPFMTCSTRPAIGRRWIQQYQSDVFPLDEVISRGHPAKPPRYYDKFLEQTEPDLALKIKRDRYEKSKTNPERDDYQRLEVRRKVKEKQLEKSLKSL